MSIVHTLKKLVDPIQALKEEAELRSHREQPVQKKAADPPSFKCRVCGYEDREGDYCPNCLAQTMERAPQLP